LESTHSRAACKLGYKLEKSTRSRKEGRKIIIDKFSVRGNLKTNYRELGRILKNLGFELVEARKIDAEILIKSKILIIPCKDLARYLPSEVTAIKEYLLSGGNLLVLSHAGGDLRLSSNVYQITSQFGILTRSDNVTDDTKNLGDPELVEINKINQEHPITKNIFKIAYVHGCSLIIRKRSGTTILARTNPTSTPPDTPIIVATTFGQGRVVFSGSYEMFSNKWINSAENKKLFLNIIKWLAGDLELEEKIQPISMEAEAAPEDYIETQIVQDKKVVEIPEKISAVPREEETELLRKILEKLEGLKSFKAILFRSLEPLKETIDEIKIAIKQINKVSEDIESMTRNFTQLHRDVKNMLKSFEARETEFLEALKDDTIAITNILEKINLLERLLLKITEK